MRLGRKYMIGTAMLASAAAVALTAPRLAQAGSDKSSQLTAEEQERLGRGELVERRLVRQQGDLRLMGGTSWQVIDAHPDVVWEALLDTPYYPRMLPQVKEVRVVSDAGRNRTLFVQHGGIAETSYYLDVRIDPKQRDMSFRVDPSRPSGIRAAWGFYAVRKYGAGKTLLAYGVMADIGDGFGSLLLRGSVHDWMMKVPWMVKRFVEGSGRFLYGRAPDRVPFFAAR